MVVFKTKLSPLSRLRLMILVCVFMTLTQDTLAMVVASACVSAHVISDESASRQSVMKLHM
ncbi:hypothetical protein D3C80_2070660 [compost metagenome]